MKISVIGTGYVGLISGTCLAEVGNSVICVDVDSEKIKKLSKGEPTIYETGLKNLLNRNIKENRLSFTTDINFAVKNSDIIFLALPTPPGEDGSADLSYIISVATNISSMIDSYKIIVNKSTVPVGTFQKVRDVISVNARSDFDVISNPEFLREGVAINDFMKPDRIVIGSSSEKAIEIMKKLYLPFIKQGNPIIITDEKSSELSKYAANSFLATKISFMNEISRLCELFGADVNYVRKIIGSDFRISNNFLYPGIGYGGSCFPKDVKALIQTSKENDYDFKILKSVTKVNNDQKIYLISKIRAFFNNNLRNKEIAVWGLSFKPNTDDIREAPALEIIDSLLNLGVKISVYDPEAIMNTKKIYGNRISYGKNQYDILKNVNALIIATEWNEFKSPDFVRISKLMSEKVIFDGRNLFNPQFMKNMNFDYISIGRKKV
jgi:UDPglucose 6-dehydrogenase